MAEWFFMSIKKLSSSNTLKKSTSNVDTVSSKLLDTLQKDHEEFRKAFVNISQVVNKIEEHSKATSETLKGFRDDNREHLVIIKDLYQNNTQHLQLIAGKKQVPISIFAISVVLLSALLVASEVRYSGLDIEITTEGIHIDRGHSNTTTLK